MQQYSPLREGFLSQPLEATLDHLKIEGKIPHWIIGSVLQMHRNRRSRNDLKLCA